MVTGGVAAFGAVLGWWAAWLRPGRSQRWAVPALVVVAAVLVDLNEGRAAVPVVIAGVLAGAAAHLLMRAAVRTGAGAAR
ncbi:hypothetical protein ACGFIR_29960 [Micromonospora sp. NPDC049051]|uniref:hypothetical protein n=1 Tax=unclassified Micromonospora TaxID=2617518 RepID=UPI003722E412